jgi:hypothetical protein
MFKQSDFTQFEIIFWYSFLAFSIFLVILFYKIKGKGSMTYRRASNKLLAEIKRLKAYEKQDNINHDVLKATPFVLSAVSTPLILERSNTNLSNAEHVLTHVREIEKLVHERNNKKDYKKQLTLILADLEDLYSEFEELRLILKK